MKFENGFDVDDDVGKDVEVYRLPDSTLDLYKAAIGPMLRKIRVAVRKQTEPDRRIQGMVLIHEDPQYFDVKLAQNIDPANPLLIQQIKKGIESAAAAHAEVKPEVSHV